MNRILTIAAVALAVCAPVGAHAGAVNDPANPDLNTKAGFLSVVAAAKELGGPPTTMCNRVVCWSTWSGSRFKLEEYDGLDGQLHSYIHTIYSKDQSILWTFDDKGMVATSNHGNSQLIRQVWP